MNLLNGSKFELPGVFSQLAKFGQPPKVDPGEARNVVDVVNQPFRRFYNPDDVHYPDHTLPINPTNGGYITMGLGPVVYDHQPQWDRGNVCDAGPVREFFAGLLFDNRVKHL